MNSYGWDWVCIFSAGWTNDSMIVVKVCARDMVERTSLTRMIGRGHAILARQSNGNLIHTRLTWLVALMASYPQAVKTECRPGLEAAPGNLDRYL